MDCLLCAESVCQKSEDCSLFDVWTRVLSGLYRNYIHQSGSNLILMFNIEVRYDFCRCLCKLIDISSVSQTGFFYFFVFPFLKRFFFVFYILKGALFWDQPKCPVCRCHFHPTVDSIPIAMDILEKVTGEALIVCLFFLWCGSLKNTLKNPSEQDLSDDLVAEHGSEFREYQFRSQTWIWFFLERIQFIIVSMWLNAAGPEMEIFRSFFEVVYRFLVKGI